PSSENLDGKVESPLTKEISNAIVDCHSRRLHKYTRFFRNLQIFTFRIRPSRDSSKPTILDNMNQIGILRNTVLINRTTELPSFFMYAQLATDLEAELMSEMCMLG